MERFELSGGAQLLARHQPRRLGAGADNHCVSDTSLVRLAIGKSGTTVAEKRAMAGTDLGAPVPAHALALHPFRTWSRAPWRAPFCARVSRIFRWGNLRRGEFLIRGAGCANRQCDQEQADIGHVNQGSIADSSGGKMARGIDRITRMPFPARLL